MTETEEMYLLTLAKMSENGTETPIPVAALADYLEIAPVSANQMVHKLAEAGWLRYIPYKGVELTPGGQLAAQRVLHHRRLWEVFLVDHLRLPLKDADALACRLEHLTPDEVAFKLADYLGNPTQSPQGYPIPALPGAPYRGTGGVPLIDAPLGEQVAVSQIPFGPAGSFLQDTGIFAGKLITVLGKASNGALYIQLETEAVHLAAAIAEKITVQAVPDESNCASYCAPYFHINRKEKHG